MFNQTNMIVGSLYAISVATGGIIALEILKLVENEERIAKNAGKKASASAMEYLQDVYRKRVDKMYDLLDSSDVSTETKNEILDLVDCPL